MAANGALREVAIGANPAGSAATRSPWLIHTGSLSPGPPTPSNSGEAAPISSSAEPYSRSSECCTTPPSVCTMPCWP